MRLEAQAKAGFYPTPPAVVDIIKTWFGKKTQGARRLLDPCCGTGEPASQIARSAGCDAYGVEINTERAQSAKNLLSKVVSGNLFSVRARPAGFSILYLNPPYDFVAADGRTELSFLKHTVSYLAPGGILLFLVPQKRITPRIARVLSAHFGNLEFRKFPGDEFSVFGQLVVAGIKKASTEINGEVLASLEDVRSADLPEMAPREFSFIIPAVGRDFFIRSSESGADELAEEIESSSLWKEPALGLLQDEEQIKSSHETIKDKNSGRVLAESTPLPENTLYPKEKELLRICAEAKRAGRKAVIYCVHTETRDITQRLTRILGEAGLEAQVLKAAKVKAAEREEWINSFRGDVLITHPRNVQTGLDLIQFPEVVWYQQDYSVYILRQASRRSWRIGQKEPVNVHHLYYKSTIQEKAITLNVKKLRAALLTEGELIEGKLVEEFEEDGLVALAKTIIDRAEEQISLESELGKLRGFEEESDMIVPEDTNLEAIDDEAFAERADDLIQSEVLNNQSRIESGQDAVACAESRRESITKREGTKSQSPAQLLLFAYVN